MSSLGAYSFCMVVTIALVVFVSFSMEYFISYVDNILIPCQHDSVWTGQKCACDNTKGVFGGKYCDVCQCEHLGVCGMTENSDSRWGCRCPSHQKWVGTLCDKCYAKEHTLEHCKGSCIEELTYTHYGPKCNTVCMPYASSQNAHCLEVSSGGGECNACNGHGTCGSTGLCQCDDGWFSIEGGEQCDTTCPDCPADKGTCTSVAGILQCICKPGYYGKNCQSECPGGVLGPCSGHGTCAFSNAGNLECTCDAHWTNDACDTRCPGDENLPSPCSGHGTCSYVDGEGKCTCDSPWTGDDCGCSELITCSGHGECNEDSTCKCFDESSGTNAANTFETHFGGPSCASCQEHWYGKNCHLFCDDNMQYEPNTNTDGNRIGCNGHGKCVYESSDISEHVTCQCSDTNPDTFCGTCMPNYYPLVGTPNTSVPVCSMECSREQTCSNRGRCNPDYDGTNNICICDTVTVGTITLDTLDPNQFCSTCKPNWFPSDMENPNRCSHYCAEDGKLERDTGSDQKIIYFSDIIGEGRYSLEGDTEAQKVCTPIIDENGETRYSPDPDCRVCSQEGTCRANGECKCSLGTTGVHCEISCGANHTGVVCSGHGRCIRNDLDMWFNPNTEDYRCECVPYDTYTPETRQRLMKRGFQVESPPAPHYHGKFCEFHCPTYNEQMCSDRGDCRTKVTAVPESPGYRTCREDTDCEDIGGSFCARLSTPWDSLMQDGTSFFSNSQNSPGYYTCATSKSCIDAIYGISWDNYCVNMLEGWYPNVLNTPSCTYSAESCREYVEEFFTSSYDGSKTWCDAAMQKLTPDIDTGGTCGPQAHADPDQFTNLWTPLCHEYSLETTCNAQEHCIFDQTQNYIQQIDTQCETLSYENCKGACRKTTAGGCTTRTYCRAKTCKDIMFENNVESLCLDIDEPPQCKQEDVDWPKFCANSTGAIRDTSKQLLITDLSSKEIFYSCYMYQRRHNPTMPLDEVPGSISINGVLRFLGEDLLLRDIRKQYIDSRVTVSSSNVCGIKDINMLDGTYCKDHLRHIVPSWVTTHYSQYDTPEGFYSWLVVCNNYVDSLWETEVLAWKRVSNVGIPCQVHYKSPGAEGSSWTSATEKQDSISYKATPWTLTCLGQQPIDLEYKNLDVLPEDASGCTWTSRSIEQQWGQTPWSATYVQDTFEQSCKEGLEKFAPTPDPVPNECDLGACALGDKCLICGGDVQCEGHATVMCVAESSVHCLEHNRCQRGGNCVQPKSMLYQAGYLCDWTPNTTIDVSIQSQTYKGVMTPQGVVSVFGIRDIIAQTPNVTIDGVTKKIQRFFPTDVDDITFMWNRIRGEDNNRGHLILPRAEPCVGNFTNWYSFCDTQRLGYGLSTRGGFGLGSGWSGEAYHLSEQHLDVRSITYSRPTDFIRVKIDLDRTKTDTMVRITCNNVPSEWFMTGEGVNVQPGASSDIDGTILTIQWIGDFKTCSIDARFHPLILSDIITNVTSMLTYSSSILSIEGRDIHIPDATESYISGYASWSFKEDGSVTHRRDLADILPQTQTCALVDGIKNTSTCQGDPPPVGMRWLIDSPQAHGESSVRIHGWSKIQESQSEMANMRIMNAEFTNIAAIHIQNRRVYVNQQKSPCQVPLHTWWHWQIDVTHQDETPRTIEDTRVYDQEWSVHIDIEGCTFSVDRVAVTAGTSEQTLQGRLGQHTHVGEVQSEHECRVQCAKHDTCRQFSFHDTHCFLSSIHCHDDPTCGHSFHNLKAVHSHKARYFEVFNEARNVETSWAAIRVEPILKWNNECPAIDTSSIDDVWRESFEEYYEPFHPDATSTCNRLATQWTLMPEYPVLVCGEEDCLGYSNDLGACGRLLEYETPSVNTDQCLASDVAAFMNLDWTSYCRYATSFDEDVSGTIPFLVKEVDMSSLCEVPIDMEKEVTETCDSDVPSVWYDQCFARTSVYEEFCSDQCLDKIEDMLADNGPDDPGICEIRKEFLDIRTNASGHDQGLPSSCNCDMNDILITDFCLMQKAYHDESGVLIPELYNTECSTKAPGCMDTLKNTLDRTEWRHWCKRLSEGNIDGVCSNTACECDTENIGVAGDFCELTCPHGLDDGEELACSGRNGKCFAKKPEERTSDIAQQRLYGEVRGGNVTGPSIPEWMKGPKPTMLGQCQCALGSGLACSIPCDRCNNGTYGEYMSSQYGICDSFNGICRGLAPFMRFNAKPSKPTEYLSYNTTSFETTQGQPAWQEPDHFLYASDDALLRRALLASDDPEGKSTGVILPPEDIPILEERFIKTMLPLFRTVCGNQENMPLVYLNDSKSLPYRGVQIPSESSVVLNTYTIPTVGHCSKIPIESRWYLCFAQGQMHAWDDISVSEGKSFGPMIVFETGNEDVPRSGVSFTKWDSRTLYAFGGQRAHLDGRSIDYFNNLYKIDVRRQPWYPVDIILVSWQLQKPLGTRPPAQSYVPIVAFAYNLFVLSSDDEGKHYLYECTLASGTRNAMWHEPIDVPLTGGVNGMVAIENTSILYISIGTGQMLYDTKNKTWGTPTVNPNVPALFQTVDGWNDRKVNCTLETKNDTLRLGGNIIAQFNANHVPAVVTVFTEEWLTIDVNTNTESARRVRNAIEWRVMASKSTNQLLLDSTEASRSEIMNTIERMYMHQARWTLASSMVLRSYLTSSMGDVQHTHHVRSIFDNVSPILISLETLTDALFANTPSTSPTQFNVHIEGDMYHRRIGVTGKYSEIVEDYVQEIDMGEDIYQLMTQWSNTLFTLQLKQKFGDGYIEWRYDGDIRSFSLLIRAEDWILSTDRADLRMDGLPETEFGWRALFVLYVSHDNMDTYDMRFQTSEFLSFSSSHCSSSASKECPGLLPYVNLPCSGHGRCNIGCQCMCEVAPSILENDENGLREIDWQDSPWRGKGCEKTCPGYDGYNFESICSGPARGKCMMDGTCACSQGFTGDACQFECPKDDEGKTCSSHGGCGTKGFDRSSFVFNGDNYLDRLVAINRKEYEKALASYYDHCLHQNFFDHPGQFPKYMSRSITYDTKELAQNACYEQNKQLKIDLTQELLRYYPVGRCIGIESLGQYYVTVTLTTPTTTTSEKSINEIFVCQPEDCTFIRHEEDEFVIVGMKQTLRTPEYEVIIDYVHGQSSGESVFEVNQRVLRIDSNWTRDYVHIHFNGVPLVSETGRIDRVVIKIIEHTVDVTIYPSIGPIPHELDTVILAPDYGGKYRYVMEEFFGYEYLLENPDTNQEQPLELFSEAEYACDQDAECIGIVEWPSPQRESWFSLLSNIQGRSRRLVTVQQYFKKMSILYVGKDGNSEYCLPVTPGLSKYPTVSFTEKYDIPIQDLDLSLATDKDISTDDEPVIEVGTGMWTNCWQWFEEIKDKKGCYDKAKSLGVFGFAYTNTTQVCLVYKGITSPSNVKLDMFNSETRLSKFNPCGVDTKWRPT